MILSFKVEMLCIIHGYFPETYYVSRPHLGDEGEVGGDDIGYPGIATGGLTVGHKDDGLAITGDLNGAQIGRAHV